MRDMVLNGNLVLKDTEIKGNLIVREKEITAIGLSRHRNGEKY